MRQELSYAGGRGSESERSRAGVGDGKRADEATGRDHDVQKDLERDRTTFRVEAHAWSVGQRAFVAHSREALVWYDYDTLRKCDPGEAAWRVLAGRAGRS